MQPTQELLPTQFRMGIFPTTRIGAYAPLIFREEVPSCRSFALYKL